MGLELGSSISPGWLGCGLDLGNTASFLCRTLLRRTECSRNFKTATFLLPLRGSRRGFFSDLHCEDWWGPQGGFSQIFISEGSPCSGSSNSWNPPARWWFQRWLLSVSTFSSFRSVCPVVSILSWIWEELLIFSLSASFVLWEQEWQRPIFLYVEEANYFF